MICLPKTDEKRLTSILYRGPDYALDFVYAHDISCYSHAKQLIEDTIRRNASPIRLEQPDKERMGGSSSSLNSSASDESNRFPGELCFIMISYIYYTSLR